MTANASKNDAIDPAQPPVDPILVCVLNLLVLGCVGYIVLGQKKKAIIAPIAWLTLLVPPSCGTLSGVIAVVAAIDGYLQAQQLQQGKPIGQWTWFQNHK